MPSLAAPFIAGLFALAALTSQTAPDDIQDKRAWLETERREMLGTLQNPNAMRDMGKATLIRVQIEQHWRGCAENEALALARASERPARLLAESALTACRPWQSALELALARGAYPYVEGPAAPERTSREDMVELSRLASLDAALARVMQWRGIAAAPAGDASPALQNTDPRARIMTAPLPIPARLAPPEPAQAPDARAADEMEIVVTAQPKGGCRVRLANRTLSEKELAAKAREWVANGTALRVVRPRGADYRCMAKIARQLGESGLRLFQFVEASEVDKPADANAK